MFEKYSVGLIKNSLTSFNLINYNRVSFVNYESKKITEKTN